MQDNRGMGHPYPPQPLPPANTPWQNTGGVLPDGRQMLAGWRPPTAMANGVTSATPGKSLEQKRESVEADQIDSNNYRTHELPNDRKGIEDTDKDSSKGGAGVGEHKGTGM